MLLKMILLVSFLIHYKRENIGRLLFFFKRAIVTFPTTDENGKSIEIDRFVGLRGKDFILGCIKAISKIQ